MQADKAGNFLAFVEMVTTVNHMPWFSFCEFEVRQVALQGDGALNCIRICRIFS